MQEVWKDIPRYEGLYQASNLGRIRTVEGKTTFTERHGYRKWKSRVLKPKGCKDYNTCGYRVSLWKGGKHKDFLVARLVCTTWHEDLINTKMTVNHIDGNRLNNCIENLEWLSSSDNIKHGFETGLYAQDRVTITNKKTGEEIAFRSKVQASIWLGRCQAYISSAQSHSRETLTDINGNEYAYKVERMKPTSHSKCGYTNKPF